MTGTLWGLVAFLSLVFAALWAAVRAGAKKESDATDLRDAQAYQETMKEAVNAPVHTDAAAARERMRQRDPRKP